MYKFWKICCGFFLMALSSCSLSAQQITIINNKSSEYKIVIPQEATALEQRSANVLQKYLHEATGSQLPIIKGDAGGRQAIFIGHTRKNDLVHPDKLPAEGWLVMTTGKDLHLMGGSGKGLIYGVYTFLEKYVGCQKISDIPVLVEPRATLTIPEIREEGTPQFQYREVYYPACLEPEYLEWNKLQQFEDLWGLWGHSYDKLVPAKTYFKDHPEYYALVKGKRQPSQLCLSNDDVYRIVVADLRKRMADNPDGLYWSISPNDDIGYCQCDRCSKIDNEQGGPQGSLITFVNRVAKAFPDKKITTLAYGYTHRAPKTLKPEQNVYIFLSNIDAYRDNPLMNEGSAAAFRADLKGWGALTPNIFVWDYVTQFTNYLAPFPNLTTLQPNIQYLRDNGVKGIFAQGSGETYSEMAELRCYLITRLLNDEKADVEQLTSSFMNAYYGPKAGPILLQYLKLLQSKMTAARTKLDIYGNPINEWATWLSPDNIDVYSALFDKAEALTEGDARYEARVKKARLPMEYTVLQQARFFGIEKFGFFVKDNSAKWAVRPKFPEKVKRFVANCTIAKVTELSEGGLTPNGYQAEWDEIMRNGVTPTIAEGAQVTLKFPFTADYPAKGGRTLVDGNSGYADFSYNWLCFYGTDMVATIDLGKLMPVNTVQTHFLDDPRHWIFEPSKVQIEGSTDGVKYQLIDEKTSPEPDEHYNISRKAYTAKVTTKYRYIRVTATNRNTLPNWRYRENKKAMIACDEIYVQ